MHKKNIIRSYKITDKEINSYIYALNLKPFKSIKVNSPNPVLIKNFEECGQSNFVLAITIPNKKAGQPSDLIFYDLNTSKKVKKIPSSEIFV